MIDGLASIVIPTFNHADVLAEAIQSALDQTWPVEVIVVDDGSTDDTASVLASFKGEPRVSGYIQDHAGPSAARNRGIEASRGEFVMFLDADDTIESRKVEIQIAAMSHEVGWVLCDVDIVDERGRHQLASDRYRYKNRQLGGWIREQLAASNFIPIMSPLVRRSVLTEDVRFSDAHLPEDWHFWYRVAAHARVRYVPTVLATYRKRRGGRNSLGLPAVAPADGPVRLNLGCGTPGAASWHPMPGFVNLDRSMGWMFEDGLPQYADGSVEAISISHAAMYIDQRDWSAAFAEFARVLKPGGVIRITEDDAVNPQSSRFGGWKGSESAVTLTSAAIVMAALADAGLIPLDVTADSTHYIDTTLIQAQHGDPPDVFFVEGIKASAVLFSPHADDETLFASAAVMADHPRVVICFPSSGDYGDTETRTAEAAQAVRILGGAGVEQWDGQGLIDQMRAYDRAWHPSIVWAPHWKASHADHVAVSHAAREVFGSRVRLFHTYDAAGKVRDGQQVNPPDGWLQRKIEARACYRSQIAHQRARQFFEWDLAEYCEAG